MKKYFFCILLKHPEHFSAKAETNKSFVIKLRFIIVAKSVFENAEQCKKTDIKRF